MGAGCDGTHRPAGVRKRTNLTVGNDSRGNDSRGNTANAAIVIG